SASAHRPRARSGRGTACVAGSFPLYARARGTICASTRAGTRSNALEMRSKMRGARRCMTRGVRVHRPSAVLIAAALAGALACARTPAPRAMREPDSTDVDDPSALLSEPHHAEGALAEVTFSVKGKVADRYRQALERALLRAGMKVAEEGQT